MWYTELFLANLPFNFRTIVLFCFKYSTCILFSHLTFSPMNGATPPPQKNNRNKEYLKVVEMIPCLQTLLNIYSFLELFFFFLLPTIFNCCSTTKVLNHRFWQREMKGSNHSNIFTFLTQLLVQKQNINNVISIAHLREFHTKVHSPHFKYDR